MAERGLHTLPAIGVGFTLSVLYRHKPTLIEGKTMTRSDAGKLGWTASRQAQKAQHDLFVASYYKQPKHCLYCDKELPYEKRYNKFCDQSCAAIFNNQRRYRSSTENTELKSGAQHTITTPKRDRQPKLCEECGNPLRPEQRYNRRFCCYECSAKFAARKHMDSLLQKFASADATGEFPIYFQGEANRKLVRKYLEHKYGHKCSICGITEWIGQPVPLVVDHIDGNALNRKIENFRLVCANCDAQLPTYKSKNKHGRKWRRKYEQYK